MTFRNRLRSFWWKQLRSRWHAFQWPVVGGLAILALVLGCSGFNKHYAALGETRSVWDIFYFSLQLFTLESGSLSRPISWELELARFLAPTVVAYTAAKALVTIFSEQIQMLRVRFMKDHVAICGLGRKGLLLARAFHDQGHRVVVIDQDEKNSKIESCKELGIVVLNGNAADKAVLRKAGVHKARYIFSVCGQDGVNAEVAIHSRDLASDPKVNVVTCLIHIADLELRNLLKEKEILTQKADFFRMEFFNVFESGARALLNEYPIISQPDDEKCNQTHILVIGLGGFGESLVVHAARIWQAIYSKTAERLHISIIDRVAERKTKSLSLRYPQLEKVCDLVTYDMEIQSPEFQQAEFLLNPHGDCAPTTIYVCLDNDERALSTALTMLQRVREYRIPIVVRMTRDAGLATLLQGEDICQGGFECLHAFGLLDKTCKPDLLLGGTHETLARIIHEDYVRKEKENGKTIKDNPSLVDWEDLPEDLKESNRHQADHIGIKLNAVGCGVNLLTDWDAKLLEFEPEEIEMMAEMEHERWIVDRENAGWKHAPGKKNIEKKTSPYMVPWEDDDLTEDIKDYDRNTVRGLPEFLAKAGFLSYRLK